MKLAILLKAKAVPIGTIKTYSGRDYIKTANGWKFHGKGDKQVTKDITAIQTNVATKPAMDKTTKELSPKAKEIMETTGIKCLDRKAEEYVSDQLHIFEPSQEAPKYIKRAVRECSLDFERFNLKKMSSFMVIWGAVDSWLKNYKDRIDIFDGLDEDFKRGFTGRAENLKEVYEKKSEYEKNASRRGDEFYERIETLAAEQNEARMKGDDILYKEWTEKREKAKDEHKLIRENPTPEEAEWQRKANEMGNEALNSEREFRNFTKKWRKNREKGKNMDKDAANKLAALYSTFKLNSTLYSKANKEKKQQTPLLTSKEVYDIMTMANRSPSYTNSVMEKMIMDKRIGGMSEASQKAIRKKLSREGREYSQKIALRSLDRGRCQRVLEYLKNSFDKTQHGGFGFRIKGIYKIEEAGYYEKWKSIEKEKGNVKIGYHATTFENASKIAKGGFELRKARTGRMLGDGIYLTDVSSKSIQYAGDYGRSDDRGVMFVCKAAMGNVKYSDHNLPNGHDTVYAKKGQGRLLNDEFCVKNPKAVLPMLWIDIERTRDKVQEIDNEWLNK
jgi:hypothetical protein